MPALAVALIAVALSVVIDTDGPEGSLPEAAPAALVTAVRHNASDGFSGTVVSRIALGLPALPALPGWSPTSEETSFASLLAGSHTMQVWYAGVDRQRVALLGAGAETDLFRNGRDVWQWSSAHGVAEHTVLSLESVLTFAQHLPVALTPAALADGALSALDGSTELSVAPEVTVADRAAYDLVLTPQNRATKVGSVHIAIDGATKVPLGVQVYAKGSADAAIDVSFTRIRFGAPAERNFAYVPQPNTKVSEAADEHPFQTPVAAIPTVSGGGWSSVFRLAGGAPVVDVASNAATFRHLPAVSGHWGKGRLVESDLLSLLVTNDGRVFAGAVRPARLYYAAAHSAAK
ncbi:MAG: hypothetical protein QOI15_2897 [Pseudonocardiales bacterium]|nr:hypothetical protein [Pseudonocardiales bacterium]